MRCDVVDVNTEVVSREQPSDQRLLTFPSVAGAPTEVLTSLERTHKVATDINVPAPCMPYDQYLLQMPNMMDNANENSFHHDLGMVEESSEEEGLGLVADHMPTVGNMNDDDYDIRLANIIEQSGRYNFQGCRIPVKSNWNTDLLSQLLTDYHDKQITELL